MSLKKAFPGTPHIWKRYLLPDILSFFHVFDVRKGAEYHPTSSQKKSHPTTYKYITVQHAFENWLAY
jgi:hypothetical protein